MGYHGDQIVSAIEGMVEAEVSSYLSDFEDRINELEEKDFDALESSVEALEELVGSNDSDELSQAVKDVQIQANAIAEVLNRNDLDHLSERVKAIEGIDIPAHAEQTLKQFMLQNQERIGEMETELSNLRILLCSLADAVLKFADRSKGR